MGEFQSTLTAIAGNLGSTTMSLADRTTPTPPNLKPLALTKSPGFIGHPDIPEGCEIYPNFPVHQDVILHDARLPDPLTSHEDTKHHAIIVPLATGTHERVSDLDEATWSH